MTLRTAARLVMVAAVAAVGVCTTFSALASQEKKIDITGIWAFTVLSDAGTGLPTVTFKQEGEKLTGHYSSMLVGEANLTGTLKGQVIEFTVHANIQGFELELKFDGKLEGNDSMKGKLSTGGFGDGTFTAKHK